MFRSLDEFGEIVTSARDKPLSWFMSSRWCLADFAEREDGRVDFVLQIFGKFVGASVVDITLNHRRALLDSIPGDDQIPCFCREDLIVVLENKTRTERDEIFTLLID